MTLWYESTPFSVLVPMGNTLPRVWAPRWGIHRFGHLGSYRPQASYLLNCFETGSGNVSSAPQGSSAPGPPGYDCYGQCYGSVLYQQAGWDSFPFPGMSSRGIIRVALVPGHS